MKKQFSHEFARKPPSLFDKVLMRKNTKSNLAYLLKEGVVCVSEHLEDAHYVLGGGSILQTVVWPMEGTYDDVYEYEYIAYINNHYGQHVTCVFDGYGDPSSTKNYEQDRRVNGNLAPDIIFTRDTSLSRYRQKEFLNNPRNKLSLSHCYRQNFI